MITVAPTVYFKHPSLTDDQENLALLVQEWLTSAKVGKMARPDTPAGKRLLLSSQHQ